MSERVSERVNVYFVLLTIHHSSLVRTILFGFCIVFYAPIVPTKIKNTHKERKAHTTIWSTLSVLFHFLGLILKLYDRNFSAGQPINARVWKCECVRSSRMYAMYAMSACVCVWRFHILCEITKLIVIGSFLGFKLKWHENIFSIR